MSSSLEKWAQIEIPSDIIVEESKEVPPKDLAGSTPIWENPVVDEDRTGQFSRPISSPDAFDDTRDISKELRELDQKYPMDDTSPGFSVFEKSDDIKEPKETGKTSELESWYETNVVKSTETLAKLQEEYFKSKEDTRFQWAKDYPTLAEFLGKSLEYATMTPIGKGSGIRRATEPLPVKKRIEDPANINKQLQIDTPEVDTLIESSWNKMVKKAKDEEVTQRRSEFKEIKGALEDQQSSGGKGRTSRLMSGDIAPKHKAGTDPKSISKLTRDDINEMSWSEMDYAREIIEERLAKIKPENLKESGPLQKTLEELVSQIEMHERGLRDIPGGKEGKPHELGAAKTPEDLLLENDTKLRTKVEELRTDGYSIDRIADVLTRYYTEPGIRVTTTNVKNMLKERDLFGEVIITTPKGGRSRSETSRSGDTISKEVGQEEFDFRSTQREFDLTPSNRPEGSRVKEVREFILKRDKGQPHKELIQDIRARYPELDISDSRLKQHIGWVRRQVDTGRIKTE